MTTKPKNRNQKSGVGQVQFRKLTNP